MKLKIKNIDNRGKFAEQLSYFIHYRGFVPYKPNKNDDSFWTIDGNNNWKVKFYSDEIFELIYRYDGGYFCDEKPSFLLSKWVAFLYDCEIVKEERDDSIR